MNTFLEVHIPFPDNFYTLYSDGLHTAKTDTESGTYLYYDAGSLIYLYYTYPSHRRVYVIRNLQSDDSVALPGVSKHVRVLFKAFASRVDKTKKAVSFLQKHFYGAYTLPDGFYYRLYVIIQKSGKLNYEEIRALYVSFSGRK